MPSSLPSVPQHAAPPHEGWAGRDEDRLVEQIFPVSREFLLADDGRGDGVAGTIGEDDSVAQPGLPGIDELERRQIERQLQRLDEPEAGFLVIE